MSDLQNTDLPAGLQFTSKHLRTLARRTYAAKQASRLNCMQPVTPATSHRHGKVKSEPLEELTDAKSASLSGPRLWKFVAFLPCA